MPQAGPNPYAWHNWYHCVGSTYATWLPGDPRGFRAFQHTIHINGDYKNPPPAGNDAGLHHIKQRDLKHPPVVLNTEQQHIIAQAMTEKLLDDGCEPIALTVSANHFHLLARFPLLDHTKTERHKSQTLQDGRDPSPRHHLGRARRHASFKLTEASLKPESPVWAARPKCEPIKDRSHQVNVARYIQRHHKEGATVWLHHKGILP
ncbi:MAG: hypothetical protein AAF750_17425 [Planctomycetota bacterium]